MTPRFDSACWMNSSGETTLLKSLDCTSGTSPSSLNIFIVRRSTWSQGYLPVRTASDSGKKLALSSCNQIVCALRFFYAKTLKRAFLLHR
jgi:hypothetical protein